MNLFDLGYNDWFQQKQADLNRPDCSIARVTRVDRGRYLVRNEEAEVQGELTGKLLFSLDSGENLPCVGDWVLVQYFNEGTLAIIHDIFPRKTVLRRKAAGRQSGYQLIAANIDVAFVMQSCDADFNLRRMERYLVMVRDGGIEPVILLSKRDLVNREMLGQRLDAGSRARVDAPVIPFSNVSEEGLPAIQDLLEKGKTYCLIGSSGVGKTTLLNHLLGEELFATRSVRENDGKGRHTTTQRQMIRLANGALLIDTPGMRELGMLGVDSGLTESFSDIVALTEECRFADCSHTSEPDCALLDAVERGDLSGERLQSYLKLVKESEFHEMSYIERRKKDKDFGRMVKSVKQEIQNRKPR